MIQSCLCCLTLFLSILNTFNYGSLVLYRSLINFSLMCYYLWMNLERHKNSIKSQREHITRHHFLWSIKIHWKTRSIFWWVIFEVPKGFHHNLNLMHPIRGSSTESHIYKYPLIFNIWDKLKEAKDVVIRQYYYNLE